MHLMIFALAAALVVDFSLAVFAVTRSDRSRTVYFSILCMAFGIYTVAYLVEILSATPDGVLSALKVENFAIPLISPLFLLTTVSIFRPDRLRRWHLKAAFCYGLFFFFAVLSNEYHMLYYTSIETTSYGPVSFSKLGRGPLYAAQQIFSFIFMFSAYGILIERFAHGSRKQRRGITYFAAGSAVGFSANIVNLSNVFPSGVDLVPPAFAVGLICFALCIFRDDMVEVLGSAFDSAIAGMNDAMIVLDRDMDFLYRNESAKAIFPSLMDCSHMANALSLPDWPEELGDLSREGEAAFVRPDASGEARSYRARVSEIVGESGRRIGASIIIRDVTDEARMIAQLEELAWSDPLTGIMNRRRFFETVERELAAAKRLGRTTALISFDVDRFKSVNDTYGHIAGDEVLRETARVVESQLRAYDIFARVGGEEFYIFTQSQGMDGLYSFASRLRLAIENNTVRTPCVDINCTASFGIAEIPPGGDLERALLEADAAMYAAKEQGRNRVVVAAG